MYSMRNNIILANLVKSQGRVNVQYKASQNTCQSNCSKALIGGRRAQPAPISHNTDAREIVGGSVHAHGNNQ